MDNNYSEKQKLELWGSIQKTINFLSYNYSIKQPVLKGSFFKDLSPEVFCLCLQKFDENKKTTFKTYFCNAFKFKCQNEIKKNVKRNFIFHFGSDIDYIAKEAYSWHSTARKDVTPPGTIQTAITDIFNPGMIKDIVIDLIFLSGCISDKRPAIAKKYNLRYSVVDKYFIEIKRRILE